MDEEAQLARQLLDRGVTRLSEREQRVIFHSVKRLHIARNVAVFSKNSRPLASALRDLSLFVA